MLWHLTRVCTVRGMVSVVISFAIISAKPNSDAVQNRIP